MDEHAPIDASEVEKSAMKVHDTPRDHAGSSIDKLDTNEHAKKEGQPDAVLEKESFSCEMGTEAVLTADDVMRAGGFGAADGIGSFLPVAIDSTDFEASLRDARDFEGPQEEIPRPGLGWKAVTDPAQSETNLLKS